MGTNADCFLRNRHSFPEDPASSSAAKGQGSSSSKVRRTVVAAAVFGIVSLCSCDKASRHSNSVEPKRIVGPERMAVHAELPGAKGERIAIVPQQGDAHPIYSLINIRSAMRYGDYRWLEDRVPVGRIWVRIDLRQQLISVFRGGHEIGTSVILYGADKKPTPLGTFPILARFKDHRSGPYDAPMPYTLRLTSDGVSIHGSNVRWGAATHGCIGVPLDFAEKLFEQARVGDPVTITDDAPPRANS